MADYGRRFGGPRGRQDGQGTRSAWTTGNGTSTTDQSSDQDLMGNQAMLDQLSAGTDTDADAVLFNLQTTGASDVTASQDGLSGGLDASQTMAQTDKARVLALKAEIEAAASQHRLPPALLAAIASRETRGGNALDSTGYSRYDANGFGVMQVDRRYHDVQGTAKSQAHISQAAGILSGYRDQMAAKFPDWTDAQVLRGAVAAYNTGPSNIKSLADVDKTTTGGDYSSDVWARARTFAPLFGSSATAS